MPTEKKEIVKSDLEIIKAFNPNQLAEFEKQKRLVSKHLGLDISVIETMQLKVIQKSAKSYESNELAEKLSNAQQNLLHTEQEKKALRTLHLFASDKSESILNLIDSNLDRFFLDSALTGSKSISQNHIDSNSGDNIKISITANRKKLTPEQENRSEEIKLIKSSLGKLLIMVHSKEALEKNPELITTEKLTTALRNCCGAGKTSFSDSLFESKIEKQIREVDFEFSVKIGIDKKPVQEIEDLKKEFSAKEKQNVIKRTKAENERKKEISANIRETEKELENQPKISLAQLADLATEKALQDHSKTIQK